MEVNRGGFTLLEVMVSLAILATAFAGVLRLHSDSMEMVISGQVYTRASELAQYKMTEIELTGIKDLSFLSGEFVDLAPDYIWGIEVEPTPLEPWVKVTVSVSHKNMRKGGAFQLTEYMLPEPVEKP